MTSARSSRWQRRLQSLRTDVGRWGVLRVLHMYLMSRLAPVLHLSYAMLRPLGQMPVITSCSGCSIRLATPEDLEQAARDPALELDLESLTGAIARGDLCIAAFDGDRIVAYTWRAFRSAPHSDGLWIRFDRPCRYGYKALTLPEYRGRHLQEALAPFADQVCLDRGFTLGISFIETHNYPSLRSTRRLGTRVIGLIGYIKLFGQVRTFRTPGAARYGFGFVVAPPPGTEP